jgi:hypothetical protein
MKALNGRLDLTQRSRCAPLLWRIRWQGAAKRTQLGGSVAKLLQRQRIFRIMLPQECLASRTAPLRVGEPNPEPAAMTTLTACGPCTYRSYREPTPSWHPSTKRGKFRT